MRYKSPSYLCDECSYIKIPFIFRMSDSATTNITDPTNTDPTNDSIWSNLKNKITYNFYNFATDPNANNFAANRANNQNQNQTNVVNTVPDTTDDTNGDPTKFSALRLAKKVGNQTLDILKKVIFPFIAIMLAMIVANEAIVYSVPIRLIFFIFTLIICLFAKPFCVILGIFYLFKGGYSYYVNHMTDRPKKDIMPTIFALLPITTYKPMSSLGSFLLYPFTYPKTDESSIQLPKIMKAYYGDLEESFKDINKVKNLPLFVNDIKQIQKDLSQLHDLSGSVINFKANQNNKIVGTVVASAPLAENVVNKSNSSSVPSAPPANNLNSKLSTSPVNENNPN